MDLPFPVVLASASPRRRELLGDLLTDFAVVPADIDEEAAGNPDPWVAAQRIAREKALALRDAHPEALIIAGDTVVALPEGEDWQQLAKPSDEADARAMLSTLSGQTHTVVTGVCLIWPTGMTAFTESSRVAFRKLSADEIAAYVATGEPMDKAGSYGFQDKGRALVERLEGSETNVIGLPMEKLEEALRELE